jgi:hypothetical protein
MMVELVLVLTSNVLCVPLFIVSLITFSFSVLAFYIQLKLTSLKVLFLSSDTGGGHRASAESLAKQFQIQYPGSTYDLLDVMSEDGIYPYNSLVQSYKHLSAHPKQW